MQRLACVFAGLLMGVVRLSATPCVSGNSLASYETLGVTGCTLGPQTLENFSYSFSQTGGATQLSDSDIFVTLDTGASSYGVSLSFSGYNVASGQTATYTIGYTWDSRPIDGMGDVLDPPTGVNVLTDGCIGAGFVGTSCSGTELSISVNPGSPNASITFAPTATLGILDTITYTGPASFDSLEGDASVIPEPSNLLLAVMGVIILLFRKTIDFGFQGRPEYRLRTRREQ